MKRFIPAFILAIYCAFLIRIMILRDIPLIRLGSLQLNFGGADANGQSNLIPFKTISSYLFGHKGLLIVGINIGGNIALLVPVGFLLAFIFQQFSWKKMLSIAVIACFAIEGMQVVLRTGIFDIDDVILNALGVMLGYWIYLGMVKILRARK